MPARHSFVIADDHPLFRGALREALAGIGDVGAIHEAGDFESAKALVLENEDIDLVLLDLSMPGASGLSGLISLRGIHPTVPMVVTPVDAWMDAMRLPLGEKREASAAGLSNPTMPASLASSCCRIDLTSAHVDVDVSASSEVWNPVAVSAKVGTTMREGCPAGASHTSAPDIPIRVE